ADGSAVTGASTHGCGHGDAVACRVGVPDRVGHRVAVPVLLVQGQLDVVPGNERSGAGVVPTGVHVHQGSARGVALEPRAALDQSLCRLPERVIGGGLDVI